MTTNGGFKIQNVKKDIIQHCKQIETIDYKKRYIV